MRVRDAVRSSVIASAFLSLVVAAPARAQSETAALLEHPKVSNPASLSGPRAESVYQAIRIELRQGYLRSGDPMAAGYQGWNRFNRTPYRSANHGERFVNHYGNAKAAGYAKFEAITPLPTGAVVAKDSFTVTRNGDLMSGPLFLMEKMPSGFKSLAGTWRFIMLRPNGDQIGITGGPGANAVRFCAECHREAGAGRDYLFFMPKEARIGAHGD